MQRRKFLAATTLALPITIGGCLGDSDPAGSGNENGNDTPPDENGTKFEYEVKQVGFLRGTNAPFADDSVGRLDVFDSSEEAYDTLPLDDFFDADRQPSNEEFIDQTDFDNELLIYVVTVWPKTNFTEIELRELEREDDMIVGTVAAVGDDPVEGDDTPTFPIALIRVFVGNDRPESVELTVVDGSENEDTIEVAVP